MPCISSITPEDVRNLDKQARMEILSKYNLEITLAELSRCRQAVRDGNIWRLVEQRSHQHPALRDAYLWLTTNPAATEYVKLNNDDMPLDEITSSQERSNQGGYEQGWNWILDSQLTPRKGGEQWAGSDTFSRPHIIAARNLLLERWHPRNSTALGGESVMIFYGQSGPWRDKCDSVVAKVLQCVPGLEVMVNTPIGLVPYTLEDLNPFCHIEGPDWIWKNKFDNVKIAQEAGIVWAFWQVNNSD